MATAHSIATRFTAVDKFSSTVRQMEGRVNKFGNTASTNLSRVERADRKMRRGFRKSLGVVGELGLGFSALMIGRDIAQSNIELNKNLKSLSAITGVTGDAFKEYEAQIDKVSKKQKVFAGDTASAFEVVGSSQPELLENAAALGKVTDAAITLSKASGDELAPSAQYLTGVMNQFGLQAQEASRTMNVMAAASVVGDTKIRQTAEAFKVAGSEAKMAGVNIEEMSGSVALLSKFGFKGANAGTKLRNVFAKMSQGRALPKEAITRLEAAGVNIDLISDKTVPYMKRLQELSKISQDSAALTKMFGTENKAVAAILLNNLPALQKNIKGVTETSAATDMAGIKTESLQSKWQELMSSFRNATTVTDSANGKFKILNKLMTFAANNMETLISVVGGLAAGYMLFKGALIAVNTAMKAYALASKVATVAQTALNIALSANPIGLVIAAIAALIGIVYMMIKKWDDWGAALAVVMGPLGLIISMIQSFRRNWDSIVQSFREGGIIAGLKRIGEVILDALLYPVQRLLEMLSNLPVVGDAIGRGAANIEDIRRRLGTVSEEENQTDTESPVKLANTDAAMSWTLTKNENYKGSATLNVVDKSGNTEVVESDNMDVKTSRTGLDWAQ